MTADAHEIIRDAISSGRGSRPLAVTCDLFAAAGAPEGEARIVLHRNANGTVTVEGRLMNELTAKATVADPKACLWHQAVVLAGGATDE